MVAGHVTDSSFYPLNQTPSLQFSWEAALDQMRASNFFVALLGLVPREIQNRGDDSPWELKDLRKTCATYYDEHLPESSIEILGHAVGGITYRHYAHRAPLAFKAIMGLPQPSAFRSLIDNGDERCSKGTVVSHCKYDDSRSRVSQTIGSTAPLYLIDAQNPTGYAQVFEEGSEAVGGNGHWHIKTLGCVSVQRAVYRFKTQIRQFSVAPTARDMSGSITASLRRRP